MIKLNSKNKFIITSILEVLFTIILILLLISIRQKTISYLYDIQSSSEDISQLEQTLGTQNLTTYDVDNAGQTLDRVESILNKALLLIKVVLPLSLFIISLVFYYLIWKTTSNTSIKRFLLASIIPLITLLFFLYFTLNYIAFRFYYIDNNPLIYLIISAVLLICTYFISLFLLSNNKSFKQNIFLAKKNISKVMFHFILILLINAIYLVLAFTVFFLTYVKTSVILPSIALFVIILIINLQRRHFVNKISKLT